MFKSKASVLASRQPKDEKYQIFVEVGDQKISLEADEANTRKFLDVVYGTTHVINGSLKMALCLACGSNDVKRRDAFRSIFIPGFGFEDYEAEVWECNKCGETGDFTEEDLGRTKELKKQAFVKRIKECFEKIKASNRNSLPGFARRSGLPPMTFTGWEENGCSDAEMLLLNQLVEKIGKEDD